MSPHPLAGNKSRMSMRTPLPRPLVPMKRGIPTQQRQGLPTMSQIRSDMARRNWQLMQRPRLDMRMRGRPKPNFR